MQPRKRVPLCLCPQNTWSNVGTQLGRAGEQQRTPPPPVYGGPCPSPRLGSWLSRWLFFICTRFMHGSQFLVSWPWWCFMPQLNPPGLVWCCIPTDAVIVVPPPSPFSPQMPPGRVAPEMQGHTLPLGLSVPWSWASSRQHRSWRQSLGTEPRLAGRREMLKVEHCWGVPGAGSWFSGFLTPAHHYLMLGWVL